MFIRLRTAVVPVLVLVLTGCPSQQADADSADSAQAVPRDDGSAAGQGALHASGDRTVDAQAVGAADVAAPEHATTAAGAADPNGTGVLPLQRGVYVRSGTGCGSPPNAAIRIYNGAGISGSSTRDCRATISSLDGNRYEVDQSCENTYDGTRTSGLQSITVADDRHFVVDEAPFVRCADGTAPAELEALSR